MRSVSALRTSALALLLALAPTAALAQTTFHMEVVASAGYRTGGSLTEAASGATYDIESSSSFGAVADVQLGSPGLFVEVAWTRQESRVPFDDAFGKGLNEVSLDSFLIGEGHNAEEAIAAFNDFPETYQAGADLPEPLFRRRVA